MTEPPSRGPTLPKDQYPINGKNRSFSEKVRKFQNFLRSGWGRWLLEKRWLLALIISFVVALLISPNIALPVRTYKVGDYTKKAIKAHRDIVIEDPAATRKRQNEAVDQVWPIYDYSASLKRDITRKIEMAFYDAREFFHPLEPDSDKGKEATGKIIPKSEIVAVKNKFQKTLGVTIDKKDLSALQQFEFRKSIQDLTQRYVEKAMSRQIVGNKKFVSDDFESKPGEKAGITIRNLDKETETFLSNMDKILDIEQAYGYLKKDIKAEDASKAGKLALKLAISLIQPNLTFNKSATEELKRLTRENLAPSVINFKKNQLIVGEGQMLSAETVEILNRLRKQHPRGESILIFLGTILFSFLFLIVLFRYAELNISKFDLTQRDVLFLASFLAFSLFMSKIAIIIIDAIGAQFEFLPPEVLLLGIPIAATAMTVRFLLNSEIAVICAIAISTLAGIVVDPSVVTILYFLIASLVGAHFIGQASQRNTIIKAGLYTGFFNAAAIITLKITLVSGSGLFSMAMLYSLLFSFMGGLVSGLVVLSITPVLEWAFGYTSNIKLLELASLNHPLLKEMVVKAPGTYSHSTLVSGLAEGAAESVGCNPLLAKVAALYHDIGKVNKPEYFVENLQDEMDNKHNTLFPRMSGLILTSHVKEGVEKAKRHNLGDQIADVIQQHHGTSLIYYFYKRAKEQEEPDKSPVNEEDFRYSGPKPQTREAAIVMLSDIVEASTRSLPNPTSVKIKRNVEEMIERSFRDGQLEECNLTLRELQLISQAFIVILNGVFHSRIKYPDPEEKESGKGVVDTDNKPAEDSSDSGSETNQDGRKDF